MTRRWRYGLVVFDCDGVLVDSELLATRAMCAVLNAAGIPATEAMIHRCFGMKQADILVRVAADCACTIPPRVATRLWPETRRLFGKALRPVAGTVAFLESLGCPRCVASSSHLERIRFSLETTGLARFFGDDTFSSHQVANGKPAPDLFLFAAARMGIAPARCVVIEDSVPGIRGARAAGMSAIGFVGASHVTPAHREALSQAGASAIAETWADVAALLAA